MLDRVQEPSILRFGVFELNAHTGELRKSGALVKLQPQPMKVLALLAGRAGELVTREELQQQIWGDSTFVDFEQGLNYCIKQIRLALGDDAETPRYVETLPRRGYRFIAPVSVANGFGATPEAAAVRRWPLVRLVVALTIVAVLGTGGYLLWKQFRPQSASTPKKVVLVVLPLENLSGDPEQEYFSDGLTDEAISRLGRLHPQGLGVIARTSAMRYKKTSKTAAEIGQELQVDYLLEGSVRRAEGRVRITVNLVEVRTGTSVWTESYERDLRDVLALQANVAGAIAEAIRLNLTSNQRALLQSSPPVRPEAYEAYLRGIYFWEKRSDEGLRLAVESFQKAIDEDPNYAPAHAGLAIAYASTAFWGVQFPLETSSKLEQAATRAIELDESLPAAHAAMGFAKFWKSGPLAAEQEFRRSLELNPADAGARGALSEMLRMTGRREEALAELRRAREDDPLALMPNNSIGWQLYLLRRYDEALAQFQATLQLDPNFALAHFDMGRVYVAKGMPQEALAAYQKARDLSGGSPFTLGGLGHCYGLAGQKNKALEILAELRSLERKRYVSPLEFVFVYIGLGEKDRAFEWLEKARAHRAQWLIYMRDDPIFDPLRPDPRFPAILSKLDLPGLPPAK